jgi:hypothetical protein
MPRTARVAPGGLVYHVLNRSVGRMHMFRKLDRLRVSIERGRPYGGDDWLRQTPPRDKSRQPMPVTDHWIQPNTPAGSFVGDKHGRRPAEGESSRATARSDWKAAGTTFRSGYQRSTLARIDWTRRVARRKPSMARRQLLAALRKPRAMNRSGARPTNRMKPAMAANAESSGRVACGFI